MRLISRLLASILVRAIAVCVCISSTTARAADTDADKVVVYKAGEDGYHTFRIPTICRAADGDLLAFAEGRKNGPGDHGDIDIVMKRSEDNGQTWSTMSLVQDEPGEETAKVWIGNPSPVVDMYDSQHPGRIWLVFTRSNAAMFVTYSDDDGITWSKRREITPTAGKKEWDWYAAGPVHGIQLERGKYRRRLVVPCDHKISADGSWGAHIVYSDDHGETWKLGAADTHAADDPLHPNESVAVELVDGRVYVNARDQHGSDPAARAVATSSDGGQSFDARFAANPEIVTSVVQNSALRFAAVDRSDKRNVLVYSCPGDRKARKDLTLLLSFDEGKSWPAKAVVHRGPAAYSDLVKLDDKRVGVLYEGGDKLYDEILFAAANVEEVEKGK